MRFLFFASLIVTLLATGFVAMSLQGTSFDWPRGKSRIETPSTPERGANDPNSTPPFDAPAAPDPVHIPPEATPEAINVETDCVRPAGQNLSQDASTAPAVPPAGAPRQNPNRGQAKPLRILTEGAYPPFNYVAADGTLAGFDVDIARALCHEAGMACQIERQAWENLLDQIGGGCADLAVASMLIPTRSARRTAAGEVIAYTHAYYKTPARFAIRKQEPELEWTREDLGAARIAVQAGSTHDAFLTQHFPKAHVQRVATLSEAKAALRDGKADALFADALALTLWTGGRAQTKKEGGECCRLVGGEYADPAFFGRGAGIALRAGDKDLLARLNAALAVIRANGTHLALATRHFGAPVN